MSSSDVPRLFATEPAPRAAHKLRVQAASTLTEAFVIDGSLQLVAQGQQSLEATLPEGTYLLKLREGDQVHEQWINLTQDLVVTPPAGTRELAAAPAAATLQKRIDAFTNGKSLAVIVTDPDGENVDIHQVTLRRMDGGGALWKSVAARSLAAIGGQADPGWYLLRVSTPGVGSYEMCVWVAPGYDTRVHLTRRIASVTKKGGKTPHFGTASIAMPKRGTAALRPQRQQLASILTAVLTAERPLLPSPELINEALYVKSDDLMVGLLAAHALHLHIQSLRDAVARKRADERDLRVQLQNMTTAIGNLLQFSKSSPDAGALAVEYGLTAPDVDFGVPPMLSQSFQMIARTQGGSLMPPTSYACRVTPALTAVRPWLVWRTNQVLKPVTIDASSALDALKGVSKVPALLAGNPVVRAIWAMRPQGRGVEEMAAAAGLPTNALLTTLAQATATRRAAKPLVARKAAKPRATKPTVARKAAKKKTAKARKPLAAKRPKPAGKRRFAAARNARKKTRR